MVDDPVPGTSSRLPLDEFVRMLVRRGRELHWLIGAGTSLPAGVPTASELIYEFKAVLFSQARRVSKRTLDLRNPEVRRQLDDHFASRRDLPDPGDPEEYAAFFEAAYPDAGDRRRLIEKMLEDADWRPVHAHIVLAGLWRLGLLHAVWTPNFDPVMEQAAVEVSGKAGWLTVADLDSPDRALNGLADPTRPLLTKMHGDFRSERLANTKAELRDADNELRRALAEAMRTRGLVVIGYSGRDDSVLDALERALEADHPYRAGFYWVIRTDSPPYPRVEGLLAAAQARGVDARVVECGGFEELMKAVQLLLEPDDALAAVFERFQPRERRSPFERPPRGGRWPKLRLNAMAVAEYPRTARIVVGRDLGHTRDIRAAVAAAGVEALVARVSAGVACFGEDAQLLDAFAAVDPSLDWVELDPFGSHQDSTVMGLLYEALARAVARDAGLFYYRRRREHLVRAKAGTSASQRLEPLRRAVGGHVEGTMPTGGEWAEALRLRLEHRYGALWLVYQPTVWHEVAKDPATEDGRREWSRERQARRYNRQYTALLKAWADVVCGGERQVELTAFEHLASGANARFVIKRLAPVVERQAT